MLFRPVTVRDVAGWAAAGQLYALLDGCASPDVPAMVESAGPDQGACLYLGRAAVSYRDKAPYLLRVDARMAETLSRRFDGQPWGCFLVSGAGFVATWRHLRGFIKVRSPDGEGWIFRFHDPRLLPAFMRSSTADELNAFFGPVQAFLTVDAAGNGYMAYRAPAIVQAPARRPIGARHRMSHANVAAFRRSAAGDRLAATFEGMAQRPHREPQTDDLLIDNPCGSGTTRMALGPKGQVDRVVSPLGRQWQLSSNDNGKLSSLRLPSGLALDLSYDAAGNLSGVARNGAERFRPRHDEQKRLVHVDFPDGTAHSIAYRDTGPLAARDPQGLFVTAQRDRLGRVERTEFDADMLAATVDGNGNVTRFVHGTGKYPEAQVYADGAKESYAFDPSGRLQQLIRCDGSRIDISRNAAGQVTQQAAADGSVASFLYDERGLLVSATNGDVALSWLYDGQGHLIEERQADVSVRYQYDAGGLFSGLTWPGGDTVRYERDADRRISAITDWAGRRHTIDYAPDDAGWRISSPEGMVATTWQDTIGQTVAQRVQGPDGALIEQSYAYDTEDRLAAQQDSRLGATRYSYDAEGQLLGVYRSSGATERFAYDSAANRIHCPLGSARFNALNQMVSQGNEQFAYDQRGNMVERRGGAGPWRYVWDGFDRLIRAEDDCGRIVRFAYDPLGRRISKDVQANGTVRTTRYIWAGEQLIREVETLSGNSVGGQDSAQTRDFAYWPDSFTPIFLRDSRRIYHYHVDPLGAPLRLTDAHGLIVWEADRSGFGAVTPRVAGIHQPLRLPGQYHDVETGLHYNRLRYYDPALGRYLSRDPIGVAGGLNLYAYAGNDPVNRADPLGLWWKAVVSAVAAVAVAVAVVVLAPVAAPVLAVALVAGAAAGAVGFGLHEALTQEEFCLSCILMAAAKGAVVGAITAVPFAFLPAAAGYGAYAAVGAGTGFLGYASDWAIDNMTGKNRPWSWKEAGIATGVGLVAGPAGKFVAARFGRTPAAAPAASKMSMVDAVGASQADDWTRSGRSWAAKHGQDVSNLSDDQIAALHGYTRNEGYKMLNPALRGEVPMTPEIEAFAGHLDDGLNQLPPYKGVSYRGSSPPADVLDQYQPGNMVSDAAPKSTAADPGKSFSGSLREEVLGESGRDISGFSKYDEAEILFPRDTKFDVLERVDNPDGSVFAKVKERP